MRQMVFLGVTCVLSAAGLLGACGGDDTTYATDGGADASYSDAGPLPLDGGAIDSGGGDAVVMDAPADAREAVAADGGCLPTTLMDPFFTLMDSSKCLVAEYTVPAASLPTLTWGRHAGPLGFEGPPAFNVVRYAVPAAATGLLTATRTRLTVSGVPGGVFWGSQALDLGFFPTLAWTAVAYTGSGVGYPGEVVMVDGAGNVAKRYNVNGFFSETAVGLAAAGGRLLYTGLSPISTAATTTNVGGLYAADACGTAASNPRLLKETDVTCGDPLKVAAWQAGGSGPVAADVDENVFAILSTFGGSQELRAFEHQTVARGKGATPGTALFTMTGFTSELAADGKAVFFQSNDASTFNALDVESVRYADDSAGKTITPTFGPTTFLRLIAVGTPVALLVDDARRLWAGVSNPVTDAGPPTSSFFVLADKP